MKYLQLIFTPTKRRRVNELVALGLFVSATLLLLSLVSYSPADPSFNTAGASVASHPAHNWIGMAGALVADLLLQFNGLPVIILPIMLAMLGTRWWRSQPVIAPGMKATGGIALLVFTPALLSLLPWHVAWRSAIPAEGLIGRIVGDFLIHYFNLTGAYILTFTCIAVALYLCTAFSLGNIHLWAQTRFTWVFAFRDRYQDWKNERVRSKAEKEAQKMTERLAQEREAQKSVKPVISTQLLPANRDIILKVGLSGTRTAPVGTKSAVSVQVVDEAELTGIDRILGTSKPVTKPVTTSRVFNDPLADYSLPSIEEAGVARKVAPAPVAALPMVNPDIATRADLGKSTKTIMPRSSGDFRLPSSAQLHRPDAAQEVHEEELKTQAQLLTEKCAEFDVFGQVTHINPGPVVTTYEFKPEAGVKYNRIVNLAEDLCLAMKAESILIERMAGKSTVGIQVPNERRETIFLREVIESPEFAATKSKLTLAMGKDINGRIVTADLASMPHLLIAGSTGAGKSVAINAFIMSLLYKATPAEVRLILVDPKRLELGNYEGVPHLYTPIITEPKLASYALRNAVREMERRLKLLAEKSVRNIGQYNALFEGITPSLFEAEEEHKPLPYIVIIIDELADLMMLDGKNVEESITRLAQMARAVGIHLILATQRPSVDVITGLIKANFPSRVSFRVATKIDSRTILDANGAESLLGRGDMLYLPSGSSRLLRVHAPLVTEREIASAVEFWKNQAAAEYDEKFLAAPKDENNKSLPGFESEESDGDEDPMLEDAVRLVLEFGKASTSLIQRRLRVGYGRAAHLIDLMEKDGIVGPADGPKPREVLKRPDWLGELAESHSLNG